MNQDNQRKSVKLTRDKNGALQAWTCKCGARKEGNRFIANGMCGSYAIPRHLFQDVTWENSPVEFPISYNRLEKYDNEVRS